MKIKALEVQLFKPVPWPTFIPKYASSPTRQHGLAKIFTDEDVEGWVITYADSFRDLASKWVGARKYIEGQDPFDRNSIEILMNRKFHWSNRIISALDMALWDLMGKTVNQPIYKLLGACRDKIPAYGSTMHYETHQEHIDVALKCKEKGFKAIKLHPYDVPDDDIRLCREVREEVGEKMILMLDTIAYPGPYKRKTLSRLERFLTS